MLKSEILIVVYFLYIKRWFKRQGKLLNHLEQIILEINLHGKCFTFNLIVC